MGARASSYDLDYEIPSGGVRNAFIRLVRTTSSAGPTFARLALGGVMLPHGLQKVFGWFGGDGLDATMRGFTTGMHIPPFFAALAIIAESVGALALITGFLSRVAALGVACTMVVAVAMVHFKNGFFMNWQGTQAGEGFEYHVLAIGLALAVVWLGGGRASLDRALFRKRACKHVGRSLSQGRAPRAKTLRRSVWID
jgi:putative oxidoreductase